MNKRRYPSGDAKEKPASSCNEVLEKQQRTVEFWLDNRSVPATASTSGIETTCEVKEEPLEATVSSSRVELACEAAINRPTSTDDRICLPAGLDIDLKVHIKTEIEDDTVGLDLKHPGEISPHLQLTHDPGTWPSEINDKTRCFLIGKGPHQDLEKDYSSYKDAHGRQFNASWFHKVLANGEKILRSWLIFSERKRALFCFACLLFTDKSKPLAAFADLDKGFTNWKHLSTAIPSHETSSLHMTCMVKWTEVSYKLKSGATESQLQAQMNDDTMKWCTVLERLLKIILFLCERNLSLWGEVKRFGEPRNGNFLGYVEFISKYDPVLERYVNYVKESPTRMDSHFSSNIQNEFIATLAETVKTTIVAEIKKSKYFSVMIDCMPDFSPTEQTSKIIRYVKLVGDNWTVEESFLGFYDCKGKNGESLAEDLEAELKQEGLIWDNCRGQCYDNASDVVEFNGVQSRILAKYGSSYYVPCFVYSLNLTGVHAASLIPQFPTYFGTLQRLFELFSISNYCWDIMRKNLKISMRQDSSARWSAKMRVVRAVSMQLPEILNTLTAIMNDTHMPPESVYQAASIKQQMSKRSFIVISSVWCQILKEIDRVDVKLRSKKITLTAACGLLKTLIDTVHGMRCKKKFEAILKCAKEKARKVEVAAESLEETKKRKRVMFFEENSDDEADTLFEEDTFSIDTFYRTVDNIVSELERRFNAMQDIEEKFSVLTMETLERVSKAECFQKCMVLSQMYPQDLCAISLSEELLSFKHFIKTVCPEATDPLGILNVIAKHNLRDMFPNIDSALRIFQTLPVSVSSCVPYFRKRRQIKNYLRATMTEERLSSLAILSIESKLAKEISFNAVIEEFAAKNDRRLPIH
ncbi:zinc finger MYM-type protein 1-like [Hemicordylus capensis]|uniref:zinc finger MYM-type protein 1-like n=1 Tax=Hemicordylus capensis TaxID=884348 RepID=UPI0023044063|nr:zinc finger MYM-type protein 1-like [Hemicordylus capensis]